MLKTKLLAIVAFLAIIAGVFLFSGGASRAQTGKVSGEKRDAILESVANYKSWRQVRKPEKKADGALTIYDSSVAG